MPKVYVHLFITITNINAPTAINPHVPASNGPMHGPIPIPVQVDAAGAFVVDPFTVDPGLNAVVVFVFDPVRGLPVPVEGGARFG